MGGFEAKGNDRPMGTEHNLRQRKRKRAEMPRGFRRLFRSIACSDKKLNERRIETLGFGGYQTHEPTVIGWMPSAQIYFRDPDGHMLEFISILPDAPDTGFIGPYSDWKKLTTGSSSTQT